MYKAYLCKGPYYNMKEKFNFQSLTVLVASVALAVVSTVVRSVLTLTALDTTYGVYKHGNILPTVYHAVLATALVALVIFAVCKAPKRSPEYTRPQSAFTTFASCVCAFMLIANTLISAYHTIYYIVENHAILAEYDKLKLFMTDEAPLVFSIIEICFAIPAIIYFIGLVGSQTKRTGVLALTSLSPIAWCALCLIRVYFDNSALQVSPNKIMSELAFLAAMIYFLSEARAQLGTINHKIYLASAGIAPVLLTTSAVPNILFSRELSISTTDNSMRYAICAVFALFIWARLFAYAKNDNTNE